MNGVMGIANGQRMVEIIADIIKYFWDQNGEGSWNDVIGMFGLVNEARVTIIGEEPLTNL